MPPPAAPINALRQPRVIPTANMIVSASTISTTQAMKVALSSKTPDISSLHGFQVSHLADS